MGATFWRELFQGFDWLVGWTASRLRFQLSCETHFYFYKKAKKKQIGIIRNRA